MNLPIKSIATISSPPRSNLSIQKREECFVLQQLSPTFPSFVYKSFTDLKNRIVKLSLDPIWSLQIQETLITITCQSSPHLLPKYEIFINESLYFTIRFYGWMLPDDHELYIEVDRTLKNITVSNLIIKIQSYGLCNGIVTPDPSKEINFQKHVIPKKFDITEYHQMP